MSVVWKKVFRDLTGSKTRTVLAVLSTAVGVFALGLVISMSAIMNGRIRDALQTSRPPAVTFVAAPLDPVTVDDIRSQPGVSAAEPAVSSFLRWKREADPDWQIAALTGRQDFGRQQTAITELTDGSWPAEHTLAVEQQTMEYFGLKPGEQILVKSGDSTLSVEITGVVRSIQTIPPVYRAGQGAFFATPETVAWLTGLSGFNTLMVRTDGWDRNAANGLAERLQTRLEADGARVDDSLVQDPTQHFSQSILDGIMVVLTGMGILSLGLSAFLIVNTINALMTQQIWQVGIFKVVGATVGRVLRIYLGTALIYGVLALAVALPAVAVGATVMSNLMLNLINVPGGTVQIVPFAFVVMVVMGLAVPVLAALIPVIGGARVSCRRAISNYGLNGGFGNSAFDRFLMGAHRRIPLLRRLPDPIVLSLRNTFRHKARVSLTLTTLTLAGVMFITVMGVDGALHKTLNTVVNEFGFDILATFAAPVPESTLAAATDGVPGVSTVETWDVRVANIRLPGGGERMIQVWALPPETGMFHFDITAGRALEPGDDRAILVNQKIAKDEGLQVGDVVSVDIGGKKADWTIVGLILNLNNGQSDCFVPVDSFAQVTGSEGRAGALAVTLSVHNPESEQAAIDGLRERFEDLGLNPTQIMGVTMVRKNNESTFRLLVNILLMMAVLAALVGSLGLAGTMSINVVERGREIGLLRSIGAAGPSIAGILLAEGLLLGIFSWLLAVPLSIPGGILFTNALTQVLLPMEYAFSFQGLAIWLVIVCVLSIFSVLWPALRATRISVRESLAYE